MKYIISAIGKTKNQHEDLITDKYLKRIKNIQIKQYEVKLNNEQKKLKKKG
jgi:23S rRNA pseudoU1915 N3-methylase RlmH